jgi:hypothetical protein
MKTTEKQKLANNPLYFSNSKTKALEEALRIFIEALYEYATKNELTEQQISSFKQLIMDSYLEKRAKYFLEDKFSNFNDYINKSFHFALKHSFDNENRESITKLFYYNNKHKLISNEQY